MNKKKLFDYNLEVLQVSQLAAISVFDFIGKKDETAADKAAVESMRKELNKINFKGTIVIGEGERDKAPMLYIGEKVGNGNALEVDIALDPLEGTRITATNEKNALTALAVGDKNSFLHAPDVYMEKIAIGPNLPNTFLDLDMPLEETLENIKEAFHNRHEELYTYSELKSPIELVNIESTLYGRIDRPSPAEIENDTQLKDAIKSYRNLIFSNSGKLIKTPVYDGNLLSDGHQIDGPAVVEEDTTTLVIEPGWLLELHKSGTYIINRKNH